MSNNLIDFSLFVRTTGSTDRTATQEMYFPPTVKKELLSVPVRTLLGFFALMGKVNCT